MDERYFKDKLSAYLDNELPPDERAIVDEYVRTHADAQEQLKQLESLKRFADANRGIGGDELHWERNARKIEAAIGSLAGEEDDVSKSSGWKRHWLKLTAVAASVGILYFISTNKDEIEKKVLPPASVSIKQAPQVVADSNANAPSLQTQKEPVPKVVVKDAQVESKQKIEATPEKGVDVIDRFGGSNQDEVQKEAAKAEPEFEIAPTMRVAEKTSPAVQEGEIATAANDTIRASADIAPPSQSDLEHWIAVRDSLTPVFSTRKESLLSKALKTPMTTSFSQSKEKSSDSRLMSWLEANYEIARQSNDMEQRVRAIDALRSYETHPDSAISSRVLEYLLKLTQQ